MPEWLTVVLALGGSTLISSIVGYIFNMVVNRPKKRREEIEANLKLITDKVAEEFQKIKEDTELQKQHHTQDKAEILAKLDLVQATNMKQNSGLQSVLKDILKVRYLGWLEKGFTITDARDDLEKMYAVYHSLGVNGVMDDYRRRFLELPIKLPGKENTSKKKSSKSKNIISNGYEEEV